MITDSEVLDTIPQEGAEEALRVFTMNRPSVNSVNWTGKSILAMARALIAFEAWRAEQEHRTQMVVTMAISSKVADLKEAKERFRNQLNEAVK